VLFGTLGLVLSIVDIGRRGGCGQSRRRASYPSSLFHNPFHCVVVVVVFHHLPSFGVRCAAFPETFAIIVVEKSKRWHFFWLVVHISRETVTSSASSVVCDCVILRHHEHPLPFRHAHHRPCISLLATQTHTTSFHHDRKPHVMN
jgi:hypothetical protein